MLVRAEVATASAELVPGIPTDIRVAAALSFPGCRTSVVTPVTPAPWVRPEVATASATVVKLSVVVVVMALPGVWLTVGS